MKKQNHVYEKPTKEEFYRDRVIRPGLRELFPDESDILLKEADYCFDELIRIALEIFEDVQADPVRYKQLQDFFAAKKTLD